MENATQFIDTLSTLRTIITVHAEYVRTLTPDQIEAADFYVSNPQITYTAEAFLTMFLRDIDKIVADLSDETLSRAATFGHRWVDEGGKIISPLLTVAYEASVVIEDYAAHPDTFDAEASIADVAQIAVDNGLPIERLADIMDVSLLS